MKKQFYSHIVETESIIIELDKLDLSKEEKTHLISIADSSLYHTIVDAILSELSKEDKKMFLKHLVSQEHDKLWELLKEKTENIEEKIKKAAQDLKEKLHQDIKEVSSKG